MTQPTIEQDIESVESCVGIWGWQSDIDAFNRILAELEALRERALPELPDGMFLDRLNQQTNSTLGNQYWVAVVGKYSGGRCDFSKPFRGPTPRAAVMASIEKIGEE
jgi:hypothetical protein